MFKLIDSEVEIVEEFLNAPTTFLEIEKNTLIEVYKTDNLPTGWVLVKLNKDNIDIKGYLNISDIKPLID